MATLGGTIKVPSLSLPTSRIYTNAKILYSSSSLALFLVQQTAKSTNKLWCVVACSAVQESSASDVSTEKKEVKNADEKESPSLAAAKSKRAAGKAAPKPLPEMMEEEVIPELKAILEAQHDVCDVELSFQDNKLEGSFSKKGVPYSFWAFFPSGNLTGPKGFSLSSYGFSGASTVEPFLVDEKKPTAKHVVFWVEKRLAAQGIIPVWQD